MALGCCSSASTTCGPGSWSLALRLERHHRQRRQRDRHARRVAVARVAVGHSEASVAHVGPAEHPGVRVEYLAVQAGLWDPDAVAEARHGREVAHEHDEILTILRVADQRNHAGLGIPEIDPLE